MIRHFSQMPATHYCNKNIFAHPVLAISSYVFLSDDGVQTLPEQSDTGPHEVINRREKLITIFVIGKPTTVNTDRVKPVFCLIFL
jgi:hypothetical protein